MLINNTKFLSTLFGGMLVLGGVVSKNSSEQTPLLGQAVNKYLGPVLFVLGWFIVAYSISDLHNFIPQLTMKSAQSFLAAIMIVISVLQMKNLMKKGIEIPKYLPGLFTAGWILLGVTIGNVYSALATIFVLVSMLFLLPLQRHHCVVDGPGMPLFTIAWFLLAFGNGLVNL